MMTGVPRLAPFLFLPLLVFGEVIEVDVGAWADVSNGVTSAGWTVNGIDRYSSKQGGYTRLDTKDDYVISPDFTNVVTQVVMSVKCSSVQTERYLTLTPTIFQSGARRQVAVPSESLTNATFTWTQSEGVRGFRLQNDTGKGSVTWAIASLTVFCVARPDPPTGLREDALYNDAFAAAWDPAPKAVRHQVRYASVTRKQPSYETVAKWDFSSVTNTFGSTRDLDKLKDENPGLLDGLSGENICMQKYEGGHIQIGMGEKLGCLVLPLPEASRSAGSRMGVLCAWKYPETGKPTMPIYFVANGKTNDLATAELTNENAEYRFPIPDGIAAESIILSSATNGITFKDQNGRVRVESFAILSDYVPGSVTTNEFKTIATRATAKVVEGLTPGEWVWSVRSFDAKGHDSPWSPFRTVILDSKSRHYPRPCSYLFAR